MLNISKKDYKSYALLCGSEVHPPHWQLEDSSATSFSALGLLGWVHTKPYGYTVLIFQEFT
jgi:hypothetical protein